MKQAKNKPRRQLSQEAVKTNDGFQNFQARVGLGTDNQASGATYGADLISRNRQLLENMYRSSWICGVAVDSVAEDMTAAGVSITSQLKPDEIETLQTGMDSLKLWDALCNTIKWGRLYGGAIAVLLIDGQRYHDELRPNTIGLVQFKGIYVLDRWMVNPSSELVSDFGPDFGEPMYFEVAAGGLPIPPGKIHHSRVIRIDGQDLPWQQRMRENGWGQSVLERLFDRLLAFDSTTQGAAQLVYKAHLRVIKIDKLRELIAAGGSAMAALTKNIDMIRALQTNEGLTLLDTTDDFSASTYSFSGLDSVLLRFGEQISGALQIPLVRLFGQSPGGLGGTGDADMRTYHEGIKRHQERRLRTPVVLLLDLLSRSLLGKPLPEGTAVDFRPLSQLAETEKSEIADKVGTAVSRAFADGTISRTVALKELRQSSTVTGIFSNVTDKDIEEAKDDPPPMGEIDIPESAASNDSWFKRFIRK